MRRTGKPWWDGLEYTCPNCGGSFVMEADDKVQDSQKRREREFGVTGELGYKYMGNARCPYCLKYFLISTFI